MAPAADHMWLTIMLDVNVRSFLIFTTLTLLLSFLWRYYVTKVYQPGRRLKGPWGVPLFGNVFQLGSEPHLSMTKLRYVYGDIFRIHIGRYPVVFVNGYHCIKQALLSQSVVFADRPQFPSYRHISDGLSLAFARYGDVYRMQKKIGNNALRIFTHGRKLETLEGKTSSEILEMISGLTNNNNKCGNIIDPQQAIKICTANIICSVAFGKRYAHQDEQLQRVVTLSDRFNDGVGLANPTDFMPWLKFIPNPKAKQLMEILSELNDWMSRKLNERRQRYKSGQQRDIIDYLLKSSRETERELVREIGITEDSILAIARDVFGAGFDTTSTCINWALLYLAKYPNIQNKIAHELDKVVGRDRLPALADRDQLVYTGAFILELFRHSSVVPFGLPHATTRDTTLEDYFLPKGTVVFFNLWSVNHDPDVWPEPSRFSPERFLTCNGTAIDKEASNKTLTFSAGRRKCLGEHLAWIEVFLAISILVQQCEFAETQSGLPSLDGRYGLALRPQSFQLVIKPREVNCNYSREMELFPPDLKI
ncbi:cytochrome P450 1A1-like [Saccoglossus kowalevskii]